MSKKSGKARRSETRPLHLAVAAATQTPANEKVRRIDVYRKSKHPRRAQPVAYASVFGLVMGAVMIALSLLSVNASTQAPVANIADPAESSGHSLGSPNAPVVITEWVDFQCPACRAYVLTREPDIQRLYVDTGKVRIVTRNFPFLGPESFLAAEATEAAGAQGHYRAYRNLLFQRQGAENSGTFSADNLKRFAAELGLDQKKFDYALDHRVYQDAVVAESKEGDALGVKATPTLFINGRKIEGVPTVDNLTKIIEEELAKKQ